MTVLQLQLVVKVLQEGSINAAADSLGISQPNASHSIKNLEKELGFAIFKRKGKGMVATEQGSLFLSHAEKILREYKAIDTIAQLKRIPRLRVGAMNYSPAIEAYVRFCSEKKDVPIGDFSCINLSLSNGISQLKDHKIDVVIGAITKEDYDSLKVQCDRDSIDVEIIDTIYMSIRIREDHPIIGKHGGDLSKITLKDLANYPFVDYYRNDDVIEQYNHKANEELACSYRIIVDERHTRLEVCSKTNAYTVGVSLPEKRLKQFGLVSIPIRTREILMVSLIHKDAIGKEDIRQYMSYLIEIAKS